MCFYRKWHTFEVNTWLQPWCVFKFNTWNVLLQLFACCVLPSALCWYAYNCQRVLYLITASNCLCLCRWSSSPERTLQSHQLYFCLALWLQSSCKVDFLAQRKKKEEVDLLFVLRPKRTLKNHPSMVSQPGVMFFLFIVCFTWASPKLLA